MIPTLGHSGNDRTMETMERSILARGEYVGGNEQAKHRVLLGQRMPSGWFWCINAGSSLVKKNDVDTGDTMYVCIWAGGI